jgi:hypothetical protein
MGRKSIELTKKQLTELEALSTYLSLEQTADYLGICRKTLLRIRQENPKIDALYKKGRAKGIGTVAQSLIKKAMEGNVTAQIFFLKTQAGWHETQIIETTGVSIVVDSQDEDA